MRREGTAGFGTADLDPGQRPAPRRGIAAVRRVASRKTVPVVLIEELWKRIERAAATFDPAEPHVLPPGAEPPALEELQGELPVPIPEDLFASLRRHDGTSGVSIEGLPSLLSVAEILAEHRALAGGVRLSDGSGNVPFERAWIPIRKDGGVWVFIDADPKSDRFGRFVGASIDESESFAVRGTLSAFLRRIADSLETRVPAGSLPGGRTPWALRLVHNLAAAGSLELNEEAETGELADCVDEAATAVSKKNFGGERAIVDAILDALINAPGVDEVHADPDDIIKIMRNQAKTG
jgi:cell wall assembly regulator SMI1